MAQVLGVGGVFLKAADSAAVREWYRRVLGFEVQEWGGARFKPRDGGVTVWAAFPDDSTYFDPSPHAVMVNLIVDDLDGVLARARDAGVEPIARDDDANGRFAWLLDPLGLKLELWQPGEE
jgi:catechol 2,3-dioxygenase-like lactoylglutathione lyase family enzyme